MNDLLSAMIFFIAIICFVIWLKNTIKSIIKEEISCIENNIEQKLEERLKSINNHIRVISLNTSLLIKDEIEDFFKKKNEK